MATPPSLGATTTGGPVVILPHEDDDAPVTCGRDWARRMNAPAHLAESAVDAPSDLLELITQHMPRPQLLVVSQQSSVWRRWLGQDPLVELMRAAPISVLAAGPSGSGPVVAAGRDIDDLRVAAFAAAAEATRRGLPLEVLHLDGPKAEDPLPTVAALGLAPALSPESTGAPAVDPLAESLGRLGRQPSIEVLNSATPRRLADRLEELDASLLVLTEKERSRWDQLFVPAEAPAIARRAPCSVLVVRPELTHHH